MTFNLDIINILIILVALVNTVYGLVVYSRNRTDATNLSFFVLTLAVSAWGFSMFAFRSTNELETALTAARILYIAAAAIPLSFLYFVLTFPREHFAFTEQQTYLLPLPFVIVTALSLWPETLIRAVQFVPWRENFIVFNPTYHLFYAFYIISYFGIGYILLFKRLRTAVGIYRQQIIYIITGTLIATLIGVSTNLLLPLAGIFFFNWVGQVGVVVMIAAISYAILKHHLFNIRVITTEVFVAALWVFIFIRTFLSENPQEQLTNSILLALVIIVGILLIRSVQKIEKLAEDLAESNKRQEGLIHFLSHEVKGYLAKSEAVFAGLVEGDFGATTPEVKDIAAQALAEDRKGVKAVMDILQAANLKSGKVRYEQKPFDVAASMRALVASFQKDFDAAGIRFESRVGTEKILVQGDKGQLMEHVFGNLLKNLVVYASGSSATLSLERRDTTARITLSDTGQGIAPEDMKHLFSEGGRGKDSLKVNVHSTGYGLFIARQIVEAHGGKIWAESEGVGKGSAFFVELPSVE